ncbi:MAG: TorF family putative porin [Betaproteobacteria bacterium]
MQTTRLAAAAALALCVLPAFADDKPAADWTFTGNAGLFSDYRFRGFTQTGYKPAFQGGFDLAHKSGFYVGNWNSNVEQGLYNGASLEMDFYGGYKGEIGGVGYDVGGYYYDYPGSGAQGTTKIDNGELYVGASYGPLSAKYWYAVTKFFELGKPPSAASDVDTKGSWYLDLNAAFDLGNGWGVQGHYGYQKIKNGHQLFGIGQLFVDKDNVSDVKLGVTKDLAGWTLGAAVVGPSEKDMLRTAESGFTRAGGKTSAVVSLSKTF